MRFSIYNKLVLLSAIMCYSCGDKEEDIFSPDESVWKQDSHTDQMTGRSSVSIYVSSIWTSVAGSVESCHLYVRNTGGNIEVYLVTGYVNLRGSEPHYIKIKVDEKPLWESGISESTDSKAVFIHNVSQIINQLRGSSKTLLRLEYYGLGDVTFSFNTNGFNEAYAGLTN